MRSVHSTVLSATLALSACATTHDTPNPGPVLPSTMEGGGNYNRLHAYVRLKRPESITTVGDAVRYYLETSGYKAQLPRTVERQNISPERSREPVTIETAIVRVIGHGYRWHIDHEARTVSLEPMPTDSPVQNHVTSTTDGVNSDVSSTGFGTF